jgi:hypothetical protein
MSMNPPPRANTSNDLIKEFLDKGGKITECPPMRRSENIEYTNGFYRKKKTDSEES